MGNKLDCNTSAPHHNHNEAQQSLKEISKNLQQYSKDNGIMVYKNQIRYFIEKLFVLNQTHVSDKIISLLKNQQQEIANQIIDDVKKIDLEGFDWLLYATSAMRRDLEIGGVGHSEYNKKQISISKIGLKYLQPGESALRRQRFLLIIDLCSHPNSSSITQPTDLLSRKSPFELFMNKISALRQRYKCRMEIVVICPKNKNQQMSKIYQDNIRILMYQSNQPCFSHENKIILYGNRVQLNQSQGDLINFILTHNYFKDMEQRYDYICFCDVTNYASPGVNPLYIGWLTKHQGVKIVAGVKGMEKEEVKVGVEKEFVVSGRQFGDIIMKVSLFGEMRMRQSELSHAFTTRIQRKHMKSYHDCYYFSRLPQNILHISITNIVKVGFSATNKIEYSNYCKEALKIKNENEEDLVEICPSILHGEPQKLEKIREVLYRKENQVNYPIIIIKSNQNDEENKMVWD